MAMVLFFAFALLLHGALGELTCEEIPVGYCSFSISSAGKRCSLETGVQIQGLECKTSEVLVIGIGEYIETDECVNACGSDRYTIGISSDALLDQHFTSKLCSKHCLQNCPNMADLYSHLALAEGVSLPTLCQAQKSSPNRATSQIKSSGTSSAPATQIFTAAFGPTSYTVAGPVRVDTIGRKLYDKTVDIAAGPAYVDTYDWT